MTPDLLDEMLDRSAPATPAAPRETDVRVMVNAARDLARPLRPRRRLGWAVAGAAIAVGGAIGGVAVASSMMPAGFASPWEDADFTHSFVLPSGRECEARVMVVDAQGGRDLVGDDLAVAHWLAGSDLWSGLDFAAAEARDARHAGLASEQTAVLDENGRLGDAQMAPSQRTPDDVYANVVSIALATAIDDELAARAIRPGDVQVWDSVRCDVVTD